MNAIQYQKTCLRCGSICVFDRSSGMYLPDFISGFGHMCKADKTLYCIFVGDGDRLQNALYCAIKARDLWIKRYEETYAELQRLKCLGFGI